MRVKIWSNSSSPTRKAECWGWTGPWSSAKSSETSLSTWTTRNGPYGMGGATPSSSARKVADSRLSRTRTIVWLSWIGIALLTQNGRCRWRRGAVGRRPVFRRGHGRPTAHEVDVVIVPMAGGGAEAGDQVEDLLEPDHYRVRAGPGGDVGALRPVGPLRPPPERLQGRVPTGSEGWCTSRTRDAASPRR